MSVTARCGRTDPHGAHVTPDRPGWCAGNRNVVVAIVEVCVDCGRESSVVCLWDATSCSECSMFRERSVAGISNVIPPCPAHGPYLVDPELGERSRLAAISGVWLAADGSAVDLWPHRTEKETQSWPSS